MSDEGSKAVEKLDQILSELRRISGKSRELPSLNRSPSERMPSRGFIIFWMGFVPLMGFLVALNLVVFLLPRLLLP